MAAYPKPFKSIPDLLQLLQDRGLVISDASKATRCLQRVGYYRLSGYWYPLRNSIVGPDGKMVVEETFRQGATFSQAVDLYVFDKMLRLHFLDAIERVEIGLRIKIADILGRRDPLAHLHANELHGNFHRKSKRGPTDHELWISNFRRTEQRSKEDFVNPFFEMHSGFEFPIWMAVEFWDFGNLSHFLPGMKIEDRRALATDFLVPREELLVSWVRSIHTVRNTCAHHSRLWNRPLADNPKPPREGEMAELDHLARDLHAQTRLYYVAAALQLLIRAIQPQSQWGEKLKILTDTFPSGPNLSLQQGAGFPENWKSLLLWS
jgi:abortive infection bacteriophage resistance protein